MRNNILKIIFVCFFLLFQSCSDCFGLEHVNKNVSEYKYKHIITLESDIFFKKGQFKLQSKSVMLLNNLGLYLLRTNKQCIIECYTSEIEVINSSQSNLELSISRADAIVQYLMQNFDIPQYNLRAFGFGDKTLQNRNENRIDFIIEEF